jgi:GNAT superfamily N-acetyltransferase
MNPDIQYRPATVDDSVFLADVVIAAEMGMSDKLSYCTLFNLSLDDARKAIISMLQEEIDGCELSVSSFTIAESDGQPIGALGGWVEGYYEGQSSQMLKSNLIGYTLGKSAIEKLQVHAPMLKEFYIPRDAGCMQIEYLFVKPEYTGRRIEVDLMQHVEDRCKRMSPSITIGQAQLLRNSIWSIKLLMKFGYSITRNIKSTFPDVTNYIAHNEKVLMEKNFIQFENGTR